MNLPNKLTILRILLVPFMVAAILIDFPCHYLVAGLIFGAASITDLIDGKIARSRNLITNFGKFCDPLADKILVTATLLCFLQQGLCDSVLLIIILFREFAVSAIRLLAATEGKVVAANIWGKIKTISQMVAIIAIFVFQFIMEILHFDVFLISYNTLTLWNNIFFWIGEALLWISTIFCIISGIIYIWDNRQFINEK